MRPLALLALPVCTGCTLSCTHLPRCAVTLQSVLRSCSYILADTLTRLKEVGGANTITVISERDVSAENANDGISFSWYTIMCQLYSV
jgi:hypothetical protein